MDELTANEGDSIAQEARGPMNLPLSEPAARFFANHPEKWKTAQEAWEADPEAVLAFIDEMAHCTDDLFHCDAGLVLIELPPNPQFAEAARALLSSPDDFARKLGAEALRLHGDASDSQVLLAHARSETDEWGREELLESYVTLAEEIDEQAVEELFATLHCLYTSIVAQVIAMRGEVRLLPLIQREASECDDDLFARVRFLFARWLLGDDVCGEGLILLATREDDLGPWLNIRDEFDYYLDKDPARATPALCRAVEAAIQHRPSLETGELVKTLAICRGSRDE